MIVVTTETYQGQESYRIAAPGCTYIYHQEGCDFAADYKEALADPNIDAVDICLPHHLHAPVARATARAGKHALGEKPLAANLNEADQIIAAADEYKKGEPMITEILPGIYTVDHAVAEGKNAIVVGRRAAWAIDAGTYAHESQEMADFIRSLGRAPERLIYTHGHGDHVLGSAAFQGAEIIAHELMPVECRRLLPMLAGRASKSVAELADQIAWPTLTFSGELALDLGDRHLRLFPTPGHSQDGISIFVEEEKLLIAGDVVVTGIVPAIGDGDSRTLEGTLARLAKMEIEILAPGHGPVIYGRNAVLDWLHWLADYLAGVRTVVRMALDQGVPPDSIAERVAYERFIGDRLPRDRHNMFIRHRNTVQKIVEEEKQ
jgi:glyoxylase-like metal-dependent hydrolase (beta-lactamase superfamily II)